RGGGGLPGARAGEGRRGRPRPSPRPAGPRGGRPEPPAARGATVEEVTPYPAAAPAGADVAGLRAALGAGDIDALTFTSSSTVHHFVELVGPDVVATLCGARRLVVACIGPVTADTAREAGLAVDVCPADYTAPALADALVDHFCNAPGDRLSRSVR